MLVISQACAARATGNCSIWIQLSAIFSWVIWKFDSDPSGSGGRPLAHNIMSNARRANAMVRMA